MHRDKRGLVVLTLLAALVAILLEPPVTVALLSDRPSPSSTAAAQDADELVRLRDLASALRDASGKSAATSSVASAEPGVLPLAGAAAAVAACESGARLPSGLATLGSHDWTAKNPVSSASGAFQFVDRTWFWVWEDLLGSAAPTPTAREASPSQQMTAFVALWRDGSGSGHWSESESCWRPMLTPQETPAQRRR